MMRVERLTRQRPSRVCSILDCGKVPKAGLTVCGKHYAATQYHGVAGVPILAVFNEGHTYVQPAPFSRRHT